MERKITILILFERQINFVLTANHFVLTPNQYIVQAFLELSNGHTCKVKNTL